MDVELSANRPNSDTEKKAKENSSAAGNHGDGHMNGMSNGFDRRKDHKSERKDKDRSSSHKSEHRDRDRSHDKSHKSDRKDKEKHKHSSSNSSKDKHGSSSSSSKDKDRKTGSSSSSRDKDLHKNSSSSLNKDKSREHHHKSSSSSKDKERHNSSSKSKDRHRHDSHDKDKSKDKDRKHGTNSKNDKDKHSTTTSSSPEKEKSRSSEKERHRHRHDKDRGEKRGNNEIKEEKPKIEDLHEDKSWINNHVSYDYHQSDDDKQESIKQEPASQTSIDDDDNDDDSSREPNLYIKEDDDDEDCGQDNSLDSTDANNTRLSDSMNNTTLKTEDDSDEDMPLSARRSSTSTNVKRKVDSDEEDDNVPLSARKKSKKESSKKKKKRKHSDNDDDDDDDEEESNEKPKKKKVPKSSRSSTNSAVGTPSPKKKKKDEEEHEVWKWWEEDKKNDGRKWTFLEHKGPVFALDYEPLPSNVKFYYNGKEMRLSEPTEEVATFYARMLDHDYTTKKIFNNNFFKDWRDVMTESERAKIMDLSKCNFKEMHQYFLQKSEERKAMSKEEKKALKEQNEEIAKEYGFCTIDGHREKIGNFKIEPPGLFRGRGEHPKMGKLKKRVIPEDVMINCSKDSVFPKAPSGHKWKEIRHDNSVTWLASWIENVQGQVKYVMLNPSSKLKGEKDWQKYELARKLAETIGQIRDTYRADLKHKEMKVRQRAVALYFIDKLALRAGNEKDEDQADTVGCCSLRVEHISLHEHKDGKDYVVVFDFLGKDSIRYNNEVPVEKRVFKNLQLFKDNKSDGDDLFDRLNTSIMNKHLNEIMNGLTAKVFRTYNASWTLQQQLNELTNPNDILAQKILSYNRANRAVAILCNHQRSIPKTHAKSMENLMGKIDTKKNDIKMAEMEVKDTKKEAKRSQKGKELHEKAKKKLERLKEQLKKLELQATDREENKDIALGTSKLNYLDPRITVAWCKKHDVPIEKIYNKTQRSKFRWAIDMAGPDYVF